MEKQRLIYLDCFRALLATLVVILHSSGVAMSAMELGSASWTCMLFANALTRIAVPCFFMLSGYLLLGHDEPIHMFFKKRFTVVVIPFIAWSLVYLAWNAYWGITVGITLTNIFNGTGASHHLWYVYAMIGLYLVTPFLRGLCSKTMSDNVLLLLVLVVMIRPLN